MYTPLAHPLRFSYYLFLLFILCLIGLALFLSFGQVKHILQWNWVDILGEGGATLFIGFWIFLLLKGRPHGHVTNYIFLGLSLIFFHLWMDTLDEFFYLPKGTNWNAWLESIPFPIGIALLTVGFIYWKQEQLAISKQLLKTERVFRDHRLFDALTPLADAHYFKAQLNALISESNEQCSHHVILLDMQHFDAINKMYGFNEGSLILQYISQILILNLRSDDLVCRLAGDRFVVLLPNTSDTQSEKISQHLKKVIATCQYYPEQSDQVISLSVYSVFTVLNHPNAHVLLHDLNQRLQQHKKSYSMRQVVI